MLRDLLPSFSVVLSPMDDITTKEYRNICKGFGADVLFSEFVSSDALIRDVEMSYQKISFTQQERPVGVQIFGNTKEKLVEAAQRVEEQQPDFIDINWGCPMKKIADKGSGSGILKDIPKMLSITKAVVNSVHIPVSVKTRIAYDDHSIAITDFAEGLQDCGIQLLSIHGRTKMQMYNGPANWTMIGQVKNNQRIKIPIFGNGDIDSAEKMLEYKNRYGVDGILIGRAAIGKPYIFKQCHQILEGEPLFEPTVKQRAMICKEHFLSMIPNYGEFRAMVIMKKFYSKYFSSIANFKPFKMQLMEAKSKNEVINILNKISDIEYLI
ncbi:MAG: tRNA dihydrouridine synthase DusB [Bacteroidales bacterium]